jgi:hypothetical protein
MLEPRTGVQGCVMVGKSRRLIEQQRRLANFADLRVKQQLQAEASSGESTAIEIGKYAGRTGMIVWIAFDLVYILSLYAIIFSLHSILKAPLAQELPRDRDKENLPVLLLQLLHQWIVDLGVHWRENTLIGDRAIKYLFDGCMTQSVSNSSFQK